MANACREPIADPVTDKERANFCDYFKPRPKAYTRRENSRTQTSKAALDDIFGLESDTNNTESTLSEAEKSRKKLDELFKK